MDTKQLIIYRNLEYQALFEELAGLLKRPESGGDRWDREAALAGRNLRL